MNGVVYSPLLSRCLASLREERMLIRDAVLLGVLDWFGLEQVLRSWGIRSVSGWGNCWAVDRRMIERRKDWRRWCMVSMRYSRKGTSMTLFPYDGTMR